MKAKKINYKLLVLLLIFSYISSAQTFKATQQKASRVKTAYTEKWDDLKAELIKRNFDATNFEICIRAFKHDKLVEIWLRSKNEKQFKLFKTYDICYYSGSLGPKRKQGDGQVPEGFYNVAVFNPYSNYYLSLGVSYPNSSDKIIGKTNLGGDIMIHGNCVSIGCIPITDTYIKELYVLAVEARNGGQQTIPISIFPAKMDEKGMNFLNSEYGDNAALLSFWKSLKTGYDYFEINKQLPKITVDKAGKYVVN
ncbi:MAG: hypothetical protein A3F72_17850 [Bacteroidetes bacterium RIFCSPLOWO2_12_FULL_35_15]|nr:MAG: hypothetical protein A3F72_17850 [Bacteroidetes bacterium RIFCSPLOWO2_12_FULL_35_15]